MKNTQKGFIGIAVLLILTAAIGGGVYYKVKVNPEFMSKKDDSGSRLPIKVLEKKTFVETENEAEAEASVDSANSLSITPPSIPANSVSRLSAPVSVGASAGVSVQACADASCFTKAMDACSPATFIQASKGEFLGSVIDINSTYETKGDARNCDLKLTFNSLKMEPSAELLSAGDTFQDETGKNIKFVDHYKELNVKLQNVNGKSMTCTVGDIENKKSIIEIIEKGEGYKFLLADDSCSGELYTLLQSYWSE